MILDAFILETNRNLSVIFETAPKHCNLHSFADYKDYSISSKEFLPTVMDVMGIKLNLPILVHFRSLIPIVDAHSCCLLFDHCLDSWT